MIDVTIEVKGLEEVKRALAEFPSRIARKVLRSSVAAGGMLLRGEIRNAAPVRSAGGMMKTGKGEMRGPGYLKKKIGARYRRRVSSFNEIHYSVGPTGQAFYGYFVEGGHKIGKRKRYGKGAGTDARGSVPPQPFMIPAFNRMTAPIIDRMKEGLIAGAMKEWAGVGFKTGV